MPKRVRFNDNVEVRLLSVDRSTHVQEIKNPLNMLRIVPGNALDTPKRLNINRWLWLVIAIIIFLLTYWFGRRHKQLRNTVSDVR